MCQLKILKKKTKNSMCLCVCVLASQPFFIKLKYDLFNAQSLKAIHLPFVTFLFIKWYVNHCVRFWLLALKTFTRFHMYICIAKPYKMYIYVENVINQKEKCWQIFAVGRLKSTFGWIYIYSVKNVEMF